MHEDLNPSVSFSFSKNILDFFDADLDWKDTKKHLEGDFSKAGFFAFDETTAKKSLSSLLKNKGYFHIRIDDKDKNNDNVELFVNQDNVELFVNQKGNEVEEAHFIIESDEKLIVFSLYGKMRLKEQK